MQVLRTSTSELQWKIRFEVRQTGYFCIQTPNAFLAFIDIAKSRLSKSFHPIPASDVCKTAVKKSLGKTNETIIIAFNLHFVMPEIRGHKGQVSRILFCFLAFQYSYSLAPSKAFKVLANVLAMSPSQPPIPSYFFRNASRLAKNG